MQAHYDIHSLYFKKQKTDRYIVLNIKLFGMLSNATQTHKRLDLKKSTLCYHPGV